MLTVEEALALVEKNTRVLSAHTTPLEDAAGLVLAADVRSDIDSPPYDKAMMDGYAVRSVDREPQRRIVEEIAAGAVPRYPVTPGTTSRIMTGAPIPEGADAVVQVERTELIDDSTVRLDQVDAAAGQHVLCRGTAVRVGDTVLTQGAMLRPIEIAILAEIGRATVDAIRRPRVAVLPTGNELVAVHETPGAGQIRNSNGPMLRAAVARAGAEAIEYGIARDDAEALRRSIEQGLAADILLLSGGVSAGKFDLVPAVLAELGVEPVFHKIAMRPGKPLWFGVKRSGTHRALVFGLPGNPVSSLVCFELFVRPAIAAMAGCGFTGLPRREARLKHAYSHAGGRAAYLPATLDEPRPTTAGGGSLAPHSVVGEVTILPWGGSADLATLARANCLVSLPTEAQQLVPGTLVEVVIL